MSTNRRYKYYTIVTSDERKISYLGFSKCQPIEGINGILMLQMMGGDERGLSYLGFRKCINRRYKW